MNKYELLNLLNDSEVQRKILSIINYEDESNAANMTDENQNFIPHADNSGNAQEKINDLESVIENLKIQLQTITSEENSAVQRASNYDRQLQEARNEIFRLKNTLSKAEQRAKDLKFELEGINSDYQHSEKQIVDLQKRIDKLHDFERGWELFQQYQKSVRMSVNFYKMAFSFVIKTSCPLSVVVLRRIRWKLFGTYSRNVW